MTDLQLLLDVYAFKSITHQRNIGDTAHIKVILHQSRALHAKKGNMHITPQGFAADIQPPLGNVQTGQMSVCQIFCGVVCNGSHATSEIKCPLITFKGQAICESLVDRLTAKEKREPCQ